MLYVARLDDTAHHRGRVFPLHESVFAPPADLLRSHRLGSSSAAAFRIGYVEYLRQRWRQNPQAFRNVITLATEDTDLTLVDDWGDEAHAPRRILAAALKQIVSKERERQARVQRRRRR